MSKVVFVSSVFNILRQDGTTNWLLNGVIINNDFFFSLSIVKKLLTSCFNSFNNNTDDVQIKFREYFQPRNEFLILFDNINLNHIPFLLREIFKDPFTTLKH